MSFVVPAAMSNPTLFPMFPIFAGLGFILPLIPLTWHLQSWNSGTCYYMIWASLACLNQFVNSIVWHNNFLNPAPIWCDISIRIMMGASVGLPAASLCINRRLYQIASVKQSTITRQDKIRVIIIDSLICVLFPMVFIALQYIVQGHRFNIFEDVGCFPALYNSIPVYFLSTMWPIVIGLISACYCTLTLIALSRRRAEFSKFLSSTAGLNASRYFRLMALAMTEMMLTIPLSSFTIWINTKATPVGPWISLADTHFDFSRVEAVPAYLWRQNRLLVVSFELTRWLNPLCSFVFFLYFGFAQEARNHYASAFKKVIRWIFPSYAKRFDARPVIKPVLPSLSPVALTKPSVSVPSPLLPVFDTKRPVSIATSFTRSFHSDLLYHDTPSPTSPPSPPSYSMVSVSYTPRHSETPSTPTLPSSQEHHDSDDRFSMYSGPKAL